MRGLETITSLVGADAIATAQAGGELTAVELLTSDAHGWPHVAWLGPGEVLVVDADTLVWCSWGNSTTSRNLAAQGQALLQAVVEGTVGKWRCEVEALGPLQVGDRVLAAFLGRVVEAKVDAVAYAEVLSGPRFRLNEPTGPVTERWEQQLAALRELVAPREQ